MSANPKSPCSALVATAAAAVLAALSGCTCSDRTYDLGAENPPFELDQTRIADDFRSFPAWSHFEFSVRPEMLSEFGSNWMKGRGTEVDRTTYRITHLPDHVEDDFRQHGGSMVDYLGRSCDRAGDDSCWFFARAWHTIRQTLE